MSDRQDGLPSRLRLLAPLWHTVTLILGLLLVSALGAWAQRRPVVGPGIVEQHRGAMGAYLAAIALDGAMFYFVWVFAAKSGTGLRELVGGRWNSAREVVVDLAIALPFWVVWEMTAILVHRLLGPNQAKSVEVLLPQAPLEILVWIGVSLTAGFCEEAVFRGYLQKQLTAWSGRTAVGLAGQALLFGIAHGYQGLKNVIVISVLGILYGVLAMWRRSTRPGMIAHAWSDVYGGLQMQWFSRLL